MNALRLVVLALPTCTLIATANCSWDDGQSWAGDRRAFAGRYVLMPEVPKPSERSQSEFVQRMEALLRESQALLQKFPPSRVRIGCVMHLGIDGTFRAGFEDLDSGTSVDEPHRVWRGTWRHGDAGIVFETTQWGHFGYLADSDASMEDGVLKIGSCRFERD